MRKGGGKSKGAEFERECCKKLSLWISNGEREDIFWRSAMSGGRATVMKKKGKENISQLGDISSVDPIGNELLNKFVIECKFYKNLKLDSLIYGKPVKDSMLGFWEQAIKTVECSTKNPIIIAKGNGKPALIGFGCQLSYTYELLIMSKVPSKPIYIYLFDEFLKQSSECIL